MGHLVSHPYPPPPCEKESNDYLSNYDVRSAVALTRTMLAIHIVLGTGSNGIVGLQRLLILWLKLGNKIVELWDQLAVKVEDLFKLLVKPISDDGKE